MNKNKLAIYDWSGGEIKISANLLWRKFFLASDIIVKLNNAEIISTGGKYQYVGKQSAIFTENRVVHSIELNWGKYVTEGHPVTIKIDNDEFFECIVRPANWWLAYLPFVLIMVVVYFVFS